MSTLPTKPPEGLRQTSGKWWLACVEQFNLVSAGEQQVLTEAARSLDRIDQCREAIEKDGLFVEGQRGKVSHPAARLEQQHRSLVLQACRQLGISSPVEE